MPPRPRQFTRCEKSGNPSVGDEDEQTSDSRALDIPSNDPALRNQQPLVKAVLADIDAIQDLLILRRHFGEELYIIDPRCSSFAAPTDISAEETRELK